MTKNGPPPPLGDTLWEVRDRGGGHKVWIFDAGVVRKSPPLAGSYILDHPREIKNRGGGEALWTFADGTLTFLRTYKGGASRFSYAFARDGGALVCTANLYFAREQGVSGIVLNSPMDGHPLVILNVRQLSSSCRVTQEDHIPIR